MNCLVTGGAGFIGSNLVDKLISYNHDVYVIDNESSDSHESFYWNKSTHNYKVDVCNYADCEKIFKESKIDYVFHLAAESKIQTCIENPIKAINTNILGTANILDLSKKYKVKKFLYSSTSAAYGLKNKVPLNENMDLDCLNTYSYSKVCGEQLCILYHDNYDLDVIIFRYFNVYGNRQPSKGQYAPVIGIFNKQKKENQKFTIVGDGEQRRDFVHVDDVVDANIFLAFSNKNKIKNPIYNVGFGKNYSINEIADMMNNEKIYLPQRQGEVRVSLSDISKIKNDFGWTPKIDLKDYLQRNLYV